MNNFYSLKKIDFKKYSEYYLTVKRGRFDVDFLEKIIAHFDKKNIKVVKIVLFGRDFQLKKYTHYSAKFPLLLICDSMVSVNSFDFSSGDELGVGACISFVELKNYPEFIYIRDEEDNVVGAYYKIDDQEFLSKTFSKKIYTQNILFKDEVVKGYSDISLLLADRKFDFKNVYRFWNYMSDVLSNYKDFNYVRDITYDREEVVKYPAATGIETSFLDLKRIAISFEAVKGGGVTFDTVSSDLQCDPYLYGPRFSRATCLYFQEKIIKIFISGISSIDNNGRSVFGNSRNENVEYVMSSVDNLLEKVHMSKENILCAYVYVVNKDILMIFESLYRFKKWNFPYIWVATPICRNDLLFEIECVASNCVENLLSNFEVTPD